MSDELPQGWEVVKLGEITCKVGSGATPRGGSESYEAQGVPLIRSMNVRFEGFTTEGLAFLSEAQAKALDAVTVKSDDVLLNITGASIGRVTQAPASMDGARVNQHVCIIRPKPELDATFLARFLASPPVQRMIWTEQYGVTRQALTKGQILTFDIPLPPLAEQQRIVAKLEKLLGQVHACQQRLAKIPALLKRFRQAVLAAAYSGRLTADWREENPDVGSGNDFLREVQTQRQKLWEEIELQKMAASGRVPVDDEWKERYRTPDLGTDVGRNDVPSTWAWEKLDGVLAYIEAGKSFSCDERPPHENEVGVLKVSAVTWGEFDEKESKTCKDERRINPDIQVRAGDFLFSRANTIELVGTCVIVKGVSSKLMLSDKTLRLHFAGTPQPYILFALRSPAGRDEIEELATGNQDSMRNIGQNRIRDIVIPFPPLAEQQEIVRRVEQLFALADRIDARFAQGRKRVERITQAILAKSFRGELVPTEFELAKAEGRSFESATELLDKIGRNGEPKRIKTKGRS